MTDIDRLIEALEHCEYRDGNDACQDCPYPGTDCALEIVKAVLKAQKPRLLTLEEVVECGDPVYIEGGVIGGTWAMMPKVFEKSIEFVANGLYTLFPAFAKAEYGKTWRCWTKRPTDGEKQEAMWIEQT